MAHLATKLPPLRSLVAFEATARHASLTDAAQELRVSREAASRHIRVLEDYLGIKLFYRRHRGVELTEAGRTFQTIVQESLQSIANGAATIRSPQHPHGITVSATIAIASFWLMPRLAMFRQKHPDLEIHMKISDAPSDMVADGIDIALRYGDGHWKGLRAQRLFGINSFPVCSPDYLRSAPPLQRAADLLRHTLINLDGAVHVAEDWHWWLGRIGVRVPKTLKTLGFDSYANVMQAALDGHGVALGFTGLATDLLAKGQLVKPLDTELTRGLAVYLVTPRSSKPPPPVRSFIRWMTAEAGLISNGVTTNPIVTD